MIVGRTSAMPTALTERRKAGLHAETNERGYESK